MKTNDPYEKGFQTVLKEIEKLYKVVISLAERSLTVKELREFADECNMTKSDEKLDAETLERYLRGKDDGDDR